MSGLRQGVIWRNWGQNQACAPAWYAEPRTEAELVSTVREGLAAGLSIRVAGNGQQVFNVNHAQNVVPIAFTKRVTCESVLHCHLDVLPD